MRAPDARWETKFGRWIDQYGVDRLASGLHSMGEPITRTAIYLWIAGDTTPRPSTALKLIALSQGALTLQQIYDHKPDLAAATRAAREVRDAH